MQQITSQDFIGFLKSFKNGKLKIYIGSAAGVGKTYRMLREAHELKERGIDVVVGYVETHGRVETEKLLTGLEVVPPATQQHQGFMIKEMDVDAIIARKPEVTIVDEAAHTNAPFCRNKKRYQDIIELLTHGISVICAFNIQHLESLNDIIYAAIGVKVYETIPDSFLSSANQVVNIDLSVEDLIQRLRTGKIYDLEKINTALQNFFKPENLSQLRELALREVAEIIEQHNQEVAAAEAPRDKLMVLLQRSCRSQKPLLRKASRLAGKLNTEWLVAYVEPTNIKLETTDLEWQSILYTDMQVATELGARFIRLKGDNPLECWLKCAEREGVNHLVLSYKPESWISYLLGKTLIQQLYKAGGSYDIYIITMPPPNHN